MLTNEQKQNTFLQSRVTALHVHYHKIRSGSTLVELTTSEFTVHMYLYYPICGRFSTINTTPMHEAGGVKVLV